MTTCGNGKVGVDPVDAARIVVEAQTAQFFDGMLLDHFTAQYIVGVYDVLASANQAKLRAMTLPKAAHVCVTLGSRKAAS